MKSCKKSLFGSPITDLQLSEFLLLFSGLMTQKNSGLDFELDFLQSCSSVPTVASQKRSMWGQAGFPFFLLLTTASINTSFLSHPTSTPDLAQLSFQLFYIGFQLSMGKGCMWFRRNNGIDLQTVRKQCTSPIWMQELLYLLKILPGLWAVGENFQIATAYIRICSPAPCLLCGLTHSPS